MNSSGSPRTLVASLWFMGAPLFPGGFVIFGLIICLDGGVCILVKKEFLLQRIDLIPSASFSPISLMMVLSKFQYIILNINIYQKNHLMLFYIHENTFWFSRQLCQSLKFVKELKSVLNECFFAIFLVQTWITNHSEEG